MIPSDAIVAECTRRLQDGESAALYLARGEAHARVKKSEAAASDFSRALDLLDRKNAGWTDLRRIVDQRLAEFPDVVEGVAKKRPKDVELWIGVGRHHASFGRWKQAAKAYGKVVGTPETINTANALRPGVEYAGVLLLSKDQLGYRQLCKQIADQSGDTDDDFRRITLLWACVLGTDNEVQLQKQIQWAENVLANSKNGSHQLAHLLGLLYYRTDQFRKAVNYFENANLRRGRWSATSAFAMALAFHRLGDHQEVRRWYKFAVLLHEANQPYPPTIPTHEMELDEWTSANVLYQEAKALIDGTKLEAN